jgi:pimeloyl-ACP methyl ester carboxylesterase
MVPLAILLGVLGGLVLVSYLVEALRSAPMPPQRLTWAPDIPIRYLDVDGSRLRYIETGSGPALVLLHTLRTQLDMFQRVIPKLSQQFTVYALDYPGHGYSHIPRVEYTADFFIETVARFLDRLDIKDAVLMGESIGGTIALVLAARGNPRVRSVVAINPYDYASGRGLRRSSLVANIVLGLARVPVLGATVMRLRQLPIESRIFRGGVKRDETMPPALMKEMYRVGERRGYYRAFMSLIHHWPSWEKARAEYGKIDRPVLLLYGDSDWSRPAEREANARAIPGSEIRTVEGGHFLSLEASDELIRSVSERVSRDSSLRSE